VANAETIIAFKGRLDKDAAAAVQAKYGDKLTETLNILVKSGLAPTPQAALMKLIGVEYDALLMGNPEIKIAMTKATGGILSGGVS
jgi:hypothetical protein